MKVVRIRSDTPFDLGYLKGRNLVLLGELTDINGKTGHALLYDFKEAKIVPKVVHLDDLEDSEF